MGVLLEGVLSERTDSILRVQSELVKKILRASAFPDVRVSSKHSTDIVVRCRVRQQAPASAACTASPPRRGATIRGRNWPRPCKGLVSPHSRGSPMRKLFGALLLI